LTSPNFCTVIEHSLFRGCHAEKEEACRTLVS